MTQTDILLAGAVAAFTVDLCIYPLDTLKTRIQSQEWKDTKLTTSLQQQRAISRGLYQGVGSVIIATLPAAGCFFTVYESLKSVFVDRGLLPQAAGYSLASAVAEMASCAILTPAEVIKQNAQVMSKRADVTGASSISASSRSTSLMAFREVTKHPGNLFRGYSALVTRNLPFTALQFPVFEELKRRLTDRAKREMNKAAGETELPLWESGAIAGCAAGTAGAAAAFATTPLDVVKTRMMLLKKSKEEIRRPGMLETARSVLKNDGGITALWRGGLLRTVWTAAGSGIYLASYSTAKIYLTKD